MARGLNKVMVIGNITAPELRHTAGGKAFLKFSVAVNEKWRDQEGNTHESTEWFRCTYWSKGAENVVQHMFQGQLVFVEGKQETRSWEDDSGQKKYAVECKVMELSLLSFRDADAPRKAPAEKPAQDDIPF